MAVTSYNFPSSVSQSGDWGGGSANLLAADGSYGTMNVSSVADSSYAILTGLGFSTSDVPAGATINGFEVIVVGANQSGLHGAGVRVKLTKDGSTLLGSNSTAATIDGTPTDFTVGGSSDLWSSTWTDSNVRSSNFGVAIVGTRADSYNGILSVDAVKLRVYYTPGSSGIIMPLPGGFF